MHFPLRKVPLGALALVLLLTACSGGGKHASNAPTTTTQPKVAAVRTSVLKIGGVDVESAGPTTPPIPTKDGQAVLTSAQGYLDDAIFAPLKDGRVGAGYAAHFDPTVKTAATGSDEATLTNAGVGKIQDLKTTATPVLLSALDGTLGELDYVATNFDVTETGKTSAGNVSITHHIELTFAPVGHAWLVTAYRVQALRKLPAGTTTTTVKAGA